MKKVRANQGPIRWGWDVNRAIIACKRISWNLSRLYLSLRSTSKAARSSTCSETSVPKFDFRRIRLEAVDKASLWRSKFSVSRSPARRSVMYLGGDQDHLNF